MNAGNEKVGGKKFLYLDKFKAYQEADVSWKLVMTKSLNDLRYRLNILYTLTSVSIIGFTIWMLTK